MKDTNQTDKKSVIQFTNRSRLGYFRNVYNVGTFALDVDSQELDLERIRESVHYKNSAKVESTKDVMGEYQFYIMYLTMLSTANGFVETKSETGKVIKKPTLTPTHVIYLAKLMSKPLDFTIPTNSKSNKITQIAAELGKTAQSFYNALHKLKKHGWVYVTEDSNIKLKTNLENVRIMVKLQLEGNGGVAFWDSLFRYTIANDRPND
jgi:hypothetical protein|tara:strand:- start:827 stop:1447 length:621 start_codon:yes stop_codon:yes gene_type:complete